METHFNGEPTLQADLRQYINLLWQWAWLIVLATLLAGVAAYITSRFQVPIYRATATFIVSETSGAQFSDYTAILTSERLARTYSEMLTKRPLLEEVINRLNLEAKFESTESLKNAVEVQLVRDTQLIDLSVEDTDPTLAALLANSLIEALVEQNENMLFGRYTTAESNLQDQIVSVEEQITRLSAEIAEEQQGQVLEIEQKIEQLESQIIDLHGEITELEIILGIYRLQGSETEGFYTRVEPSDAGRVSVLKEKELELEQLNTTLQLYQNIFYEFTITGSGKGLNQNLEFDQKKSSLALYQQTYENLLGDLETINLARMETGNNIVQIEPAIPPEKPVRPRVLMNTALAGVVGGMLAVGVIFLIETLDDTIKDPEVITTHLGLPLLGNILYVEKDEEPITVRQPRSPVSEAYRSLRTSIQYASVDYPIKTLLVTSPSPGEGKSTVSINLAIVLAQSGLRVILVDADLRRPVIHKRLNLSNRGGLTSLFVFSPDEVVSSLQAFENMSDMMVMTSGSLPPNPSELFMSERMNQILEKLKRAADIVIIDSPPLMVVTDAAVLAPRVDGVLMAIKPGETKLSACQQSVQQLQQVGGNLIGVVMNSITEKGMRSYYYKNGYYKYLDYYGESSADD